MAGTVMHLVIADRLMDVFEVKNPGYYYCGNLAPDAIMARKNYVREMKRHTHFKDGIRLHEFRKPENRKVYEERVMEFVKTFLGKPSSHWEIYFGYLIHTMVDELYLLEFRDHFMDQLIAEGKEPTDEEFIDLFTRDVDQVDWELVRTYPFRWPMPESLMLDEPYEIPGYITSEEILDSKEFIIRKNFLTTHPKEPLHVMTMEQNERFMELCVQKIPEMIKERYFISPISWPGCG